MYKILLNVDYASPLPFLYCSLIPDSERKRDEESAAWESKLKEAERTWQAKLDELERIWGRLRIGLGIEGREGRPIMYL